MRTGRDRVLVLGYGNPGREDDGLGPAAAAAIERMGWPRVTTCDPYQLNIEDSIDIAEHEAVWFIDAARTGPAPYTLREVPPAPRIDFTSHILSPEALLAITRKHFGWTPRAFLLGIRGYGFEFVERLTPAAAANLEAALAMITERLHAPQLEALP